MEKGSHAEEMKGLEEEGVFEEEHRQKIQDLAAERSGAEVMTMKVVLLS